jgi:hypothetical protein
MQLPARFLSTHYYQETGKRQILLKYGVPHRNHTRSGGPEHRRRRVRIGRVQLALHKTVATRTYSSTNNTGNAEF